MRMNTEGVTDLDLELLDAIWQLGWFILLFIVAGFECTPSLVWQTKAAMENSLGNIIVRCCFHENNIGQQNKLFYK